MPNDVPLLAFDFSGTMPAGPGDDYSLTATIPFEGRILTTNTVRIPQPRNWGFGGRELGPTGTRQAFGTFFRWGQHHQPPLGVVDMRAQGVRFQVTVHSGSMKPRQIEQAAYNNLTLAVIDVDETHQSDERRRQLFAPKPRTRMLRRLLSGSQLKSEMDKGPVQQRPRTTSAQRLPSWSRYVSPKKPGE